MKLPFETGAAEKLNPVGVESFLCPASKEGILRLVPKTPASFLFAGINRQSNSGVVFIGWSGINDLIRVEKQ